MIVRCSVCDEIITKKKQAIEDDTMCIDCERLLMDELLEDVESSDLERFLDNLELGQINFD